MVRMVGAMVVRHGTGVPGTLMMRPPGAGPLKPGVIDVILLIVYVPSLL